MPELTSFNSREFNLNFLRFRIRYYLYKTREALLRHKLILIFLFCLLTPQFSNIKMIGMPFSAILDPNYTFSIKCLSIFSILIFLVILVESQASAIKGGELRDYLFTLPITYKHNKKIDLMVLMISLSIGWLAFIFGVNDIAKATMSNILLYSYYFLYLVMVASVITFLLNFLYRNIITMIILVLVLMLLAGTSIEKNWLLNIEVSIFSGLINVIMIRKAQPRWGKKKSRSSQPCLYKSTIIDSFKLNGSLFFASMRAYKIAIIIRCLMCLLITVALVNIALCNIAIENLFIIFLVCMGSQLYVMSTLFIIFSKNEIEFKLLHLIYQYDFLLNRSIEVIGVWGLYLLFLSPLLIFVLFINPGYFLLVMSIIIANFATISINRMLYVYLSRFCYLTSLINIVFNVFMQYLIIGAYLGK